jgi:hypothetical protein
MMIVDLHTKEFKVAFVIGESVMLRSLNAKWSWFLLLAVAASTFAQTSPAQDDIRFTGIAAFTGNKRALFSVVGRAGAPTQSFILREGEKDGPIEVISINEIERSVKIKTEGKELVLSLSQNGIELAKVPAVPAVPVVAPIAAVTLVPKVTESHAPKSQVIVIGGNRAAESLIYAEPTQPAQSTG